jgi:catechol 2,3-dioxygenase-like lactoylglutathione lyase family enzyme
VSDLLLDIDHVGIAVADLEASVREYREAFGLEPIHREVVSDQGVEEVMFAVGSSYVQLLGALGPTPRSDDSWNGEARASITWAIGFETWRARWSVCARPASH